MEGGRARVRVLSSMSPNEATRAESFCLGAYDFIWGRLFNICPYSCFVFLLWHETRPFNTVLTTCRRHPRSAHGPPCMSRLLHRSVATPDHPSKLSPLVQNLRTPHSNPSTSFLFPASNGAMSQTHQRRSIPVSHSGLRVESLTLGSNFAFTSTRRNTDGNTYARGCTSVRFE